MPLLSRWLPVVRKLWVPAFVAACAAYLLLNADTLLRNNPVPEPTHPQWLLLALATQVGVWLLLASGWQRVVRERLGRSYPLSGALVQFALFSFGKYLPGKVWGAAARAVNMGRQGVNAAESVEATLHEQLLVLHSAAILSSLLLPLLLPGWLPWAFAAAAVASAAFGGKLFDWILPTVYRVLGQAQGMATRKSTSMAKGSMLVGHYAAAWMIHGAVLVMLHIALFGGIAELDGRTAGLLVLGNTVGMVAGFVAIFAPAGLGVREVAMAAVLASGMPLAEAVTLSLAMRLWTVATDLGLGGLVLLTQRQR